MPTWALTQLILNVIFDYFAIFCIVSMFYQHWMLCLLLLLPICILSEYCSRSLLFSSICLPLVWPAVRLGKGFYTFLVTLTMSVLFTLFVCVRKPNPWHLIPISNHRIDDYVFNVVCYPRLCYFCWLVFQIFMFFLFTLYDVVLCCECLLFCVA